MFTIRAVAILSRYRAATFVAPGLGRPSATFQPDRTPPSPMNVWWSANWAFTPSLTASGE